MAVLSLLRAAPSGIVMVTKLGLSLLRANGAYRRAGNSFVDELRRQGVPREIAVELKKSYPKPPTTTANWISQR